MEWLTELLANKIFVWVGFNIIVLLLLAFDLGVFHRKDHKISAKEGIIWTVIWITLAMIFNLFYWMWQGDEKAIQFFTGYVIEKSLSIDNIFVFLMLFTYFRVPGKYQYKVLFWGILGALIMRGLFIAIGSILISQFHWVLYIFGAFLIYTGIKMGLAGDEEVEPEKNPMLRFIRKYLRITPTYVNGHFFTRVKGTLYATPLFVVLITVETTDVVFAFDSIPAIFGVTKDPFIVYSSNVFAILGLRALYFALAGLMDLFSYLKYGLSAILTFVGVKMLVSPHWIKIEDIFSLAIIGSLLTISIVASILKRKPPEKREHPEEKIEQVDSPKKIGD